MRRDASVSMGLLRVDSLLDSGTQSARRRVRARRIIVRNLLTRVAGWTPSTFVSSRNARSSKQQKAEDFMDEEDLEQMKEGRQLENNEGFRNEGFAGTQEELKSRGLAEE